MSGASDLPSLHQIAEAVERQRESTAALRAVVARNDSLMSAARHLLAIAEIVLPAAGVPVAGGAMAVARIALEEFTAQRAPPT